MSREITTKRLGQKQPLSDDECKIARFDLSERIAQVRKQVKSLPLVFGEKVVSIQVQNVEQNERCFQVDSQQFAIDPRVAIHVNRGKRRSGATQPCDVQSLTVTVEWVHTSGFEAYDTPLAIEFVLSTPFWSEINKSGWFDSTGGTGRKSRLGMVAVSSVLKCMLRFRSRLD